MNLTVTIDGGEHAVVPLKDGDDRFNAEAERGALDRAYEAKESNPDAVVAVVVNTADEDDEHVEEATREWFDLIRAGDSEAVEEAILLIRTHALPEEHPLAID